jgi:hypothetical protein
MKKLSQHGSLWLLLGLIALILVACGSAVGDAAEQEQSEPATSAAEAVPTEIIEETEEPAEDAQIDEPDESAVESAESEDTEPEPAEDEDDNQEVIEDTSAESEENSSDVPQEESEEPDEEGAETSEESGDGFMTQDNRSDVLKQLTVDWTTNWNKHSVSYDEIIAAQFRDRIRSLEDPAFEDLQSASEWLEANEPVIAVEINGQARAYPLQILTLHEIVNDEFGDMPVAVTYCPLCNSAIVLDRTLDGQVYEFGTSGLLRHSDLIMYDRTTESLWQQFTGEAIVGDLTGERLTLLPSSLVSFEDFSNAFPEGMVLSKDTGFDFPYGINPYQGYDSIDNTPFLFSGPTDPRLPAMTRVVSVDLGNDLTLAYPLDVLTQLGVVNDSPDGNDLVVFHKSGTTSALDGQFISLGQDVGATGVFDPNLNGEKLTFVKIDDEISDEQTGSIWNVLGQAVEGPLAGEQLSPIVHGDHLWFSWAAFNPDTLIYDG